jgi:hypothetical protein
MIIYFRENMCTRLRITRLVALLLLVSMMVMKCCNAVVIPQSITNLDPAFLKLEVNDVFAGSLKQEIHIANPTTQDIRGGERARYASVHNISSSIGRPTMLQDDSGNTYARWQGITLGANEEIRVQIQYDVLSFSVHFLVNQSRLQDYDSNSILYRKYVQPEELIQSNDQEITEKAETATEGAKDVHEKASRIYGYVVSHLHYEAQEFERGAPWALENARAVDPSWKLFDTLDYRHFNSLQSMPENMSYSNLAFKTAVGPSEQYLQEDQTVSLLASTLAVFPALPIENVARSIVTMKQAKTILFVEKALGANLLFSSMVKAAEETLRESQIHLQNAIASFDTSPEAAQQFAAQALVEAQKATRNSLELAMTAVAVYSGTFMLASLAVVLVLSKRKKSRLPNRPK